MSFLMIDSHNDRLGFKSGFFSVVLSSLYIKSSDLHKYFFTSKYKLIFKVVGYLLSIWTIIIAVSLNVGVYPDPYTLPLVLRLYPPFAFCRFFS